MGLAKGPVSASGLQQILTHFPGAHAVLEVPSLRVLAASPAFVSLIGARAPEEILGKTPFPGEDGDLPSLMEPLLREASTAGGLLAPTRISVRHAKSHEQCFEVQCLPLDGFGDTGAMEVLLEECPVPEPSRVQGVSGGLAGRKKRSPRPRSQLDAVFRALPDLFFRVDTEGHILDYRAAREADLYVAPTEFLGRRAQDVLPPPAGNALKEGVERVLREGQPATVEYTLPWPNGVRYYEARLVPFVRGQVIAVVRDITERKQAEEQLRTSEENYRSIFNAVNDAILVHDAETGAILDVNQKTCDMYGYTVDEFRSLDVGAISTGEEPYTQERALECVRRAARGEPQLFEWRAKDRTGRVFWVEVNLKRAVIGGRQRLLAVVRDITERKRAIQELQAAHLRELRGEAERKRFYREVIRAVTNDKLRLVDRDEIPTAGVLVFTAVLEEPSAYARLRQEIRRAAKTTGMDADTLNDFLLAVGEAATNAIKHAVQSETSLYVAPDRLIARVSDHGRGIQAEDLPGALLLPGFSTRVSLGMGYTIILRLADRVWLATSALGTVIQIEKWIRPAERPAPPLAAGWERL